MDFSGNWLLIGVAGNIQSLPPFNRCFTNALNLIKVLTNKKVTKTLHMTSGGHIAVLFFIVVVFYYPLA